MFDAPSSQLQRHSLLVIEDDVVLNQLLVRELTKAGYEVVSASSWAEAKVLLSDLAPALVLLDMQLPDSNGLEPLSEIAKTRPVVMLTAYGNIKQAVEAMRLGAANYLVKPVNLDELEMVIRRAIEVNNLKSQRTLLSGSRTSRKSSPMIGESPPMLKLRNLIADVAQSDLTVLIQGESGTGKELVAQALHNDSARQLQSFVAVDCCTLQETLFESELFGHERGAFTGADRRKTGLVEAAAHGTLFLDEIGEAGPAIQAKLLRVIETDRFRRVGANDDQRADVRIVTATNRDLLTLVNSGGFRIDLYYRLSTFVIHVPPLRERQSDIPLLAQFFLHRRNLSHGTSVKTITKEAMDHLRAYSWPGNVRELRNVIERALIIAVGQNHSFIDIEHILLHNGSTVASVSYINETNNTNNDSLVVQGEPTLDHIERKYLTHLLNKYEGNRKRIAEILGVSERTAYRMLDRHNLH
ncbi:MAG: sigma-54-dependent Fis family transcriptional regulator [Polaromonas sp.]|jgi:DNA-binding NtrC family response regulator|nr:sigma-54-dependent Fis family transcriptional regulator [Polaromonas sp.]